MANLGYWLSARGADSEAEQWNVKAAELGFQGAMDNLGQLYQDRGDFVTALTWYRLGAERGYAVALANPRSFHPWPGESGDQGVSDAMLHLASLLKRTGEDAEAGEWYGRGAELGDPRAAAALAADRDSAGQATDAAAWREKAAVLAQANLARNKASIRAAYGEVAVLRHTAFMVTYGDDLARQGEEVAARSWYKQAAVFGDATAAQRLSAPPADEPA